MSEEIRGSKILILGFGREGQASLSYLQARYPQATFAIADQNPEAVNLPLVQHRGANYLEAILDYESVVRSPGIKIPGELQHRCHARGISITSATRLFFESCPGVTIGVTGTKGKSTTSALIAHILKSYFSDVRLVGNIGNPMIDALAGASAETIFVLELSSYQLDDLNRSPQVSVLLNIVPEHLNYHGSFENYVSAKGNLLRYQSSSDVAIYNPRFEIPRSLAQLARSQPFCFSDQLNTSPVFYKDGFIWSRASELQSKILELNRLKLKGQGNLQNVLAACAVAVRMRVPPLTIAQAAESFSPLEHRLEEVGTFKGITFVNDSLSTVPEALLNALEAYQGRVETIIAGGFDRGLDFSVLRQPLLQSAVKNVILFPTTGALIWKAITQDSQQHNFVRLDVETMEEAVSLSFAHTTAGKVCLMSPASPSFSVFKDYKERGDRFKQLVRQCGI